MDFHNQINRIERAERISLDLGASIQEWSKKLELVPSIAEDRLSWELRLQIHSQPPLGDWGLRFGEGVHHLRAVLDNATVAIAHESGVTDPKELGRLKFPICGTSKEWKNSNDLIASLPSAYQTAIEQVQPFQRPPTTQGTDPLLLLRNLDNADKHHLQAKALLETASLTHELVVEFETEEGAAASVPPDTEFSMPDLIDGGLLLLYRTEGRIANVGGTFSANAIVLADLGGGGMDSATGILTGLCSYTRLVMDHLTQVQ